MSSATDAAPSKRRLRVRSKKIDYTEKLFIDDDEDNYVPPNQESS